MVDMKDTSTLSSDQKGTPPRVSSIADISETRTDFRTAALPEGTTDPVFEAKAQVLNNHIQKIGMGKYQWGLFCVVGFGWASDNLWPIATSLIFTPVANEFHPNRPPLLSLAQNIGLLFGAAFWGFGCDIFGRKWAFNLTLGTTAVFGLIAASSPDFAAIGIFAALWSVGVGGNLPVDSAIFLEFLPATHQYLLTVLSVFWALAQVMATLIAWPLLGNLTCQEHAKTCTRSENMGWRYFLVTIGGIWMILFVVRFMFPLYESPKYLMGRGRDEDAVAVVHEVARRNGTTSTLTIAELEVYNVAGEQGTTAADILHRILEKINLTHVRALFATRKMAFSTSVIIAVWAFIGLGFPLYNVRSSTFPSRTLIPTYPYSPPLPPTILLPTHQYKISIT
jgi:MFS family permease